jgi:hypothetical protein
MLVISSRLYLQGCEADRSPLSSFELKFARKFMTSFCVAEEQKQLSMYSVKQISLACHIPESQRRKTNSQQIWFLER